MATPITIEEEICRAIQSGIAKCISDKLGNYNSPMDKFISEALSKRADEIKNLIDNGLTLALSDEMFRETIISSIRKKLGDLLVQRFGGELEKQVNALKSDPATRARITVAIDDIIKTTAKA